jgi:hypothetical protein
MAIDSNYDNFICDHVGNHAHDGVVIASKTALNMIYQAGAHHVKA